MTKGRRARYFHRNSLEAHRRPNAAMTSITTEWATPATSHQGAVEGEIPTE
jgi:hypothetical protein